MFCNVGLHHRARESPLRKKMMRPRALVLALLAAMDAAAAFDVSTPGRAWDVTLLRGSARHTLRVSEQEPLLAAVERSGLLPGSDCRRGNCLSCAARIVTGPPFSLRVASDTALCEEAHTLGLVLLCSTYAVGPGIEIKIGCEGEAWEVQHSLRFRKDAPCGGDLGPTPTAFRLPEDAVKLFERCRTLDA